MATNGYTDVLYVPFSATIDACVPTGITPPVVNGYSTNVDFGADTFSFGAYSQQPACEYNFSYQFEMTDGSTFPAFIGQPNTSRDFVIDSTDPADVNTYAIRLIASLDSSPIT